MKQYTKQKRAKVFNKYNGRCAYCGDELEFMHIDHIVPKQRGMDYAEAQKLGIPKGKDNIENLNPACPSCNISKSTYPLEVWRNELKLKINRLRRDVTNIRILERYGLLEFKEDKEIVFYFETLKP